MKTTFFNVGHGEAIYIEQKMKLMRGILRDYGRSRFALDTSISYRLTDINQYLLLDNNIIRERFGFKIDAVLSHAHEDHFNGFKLLYEGGSKNIFENAYIPFLRIKDLDSLGGLLIKYSIFMYRYYHTSSLIATNAKNWLLAAPIMAILSKRLWCVGQGHQINHWGISNKVLWPPLKNGNETHLKEHWSKYIEKNNLEKNFLDEDTEKIRNILSEYYLESSDSREFNVDKSIQDIEAIVSILDSSSGFHQLNLSSPQSLKTYSYNPTIDNHSLIFEIDSDDGRHLYLSDADDKTIGFMLNSNGICNKNYYLIKASHHGNRGAKPLAKNNITSDYVINCCGPAHNNWKGPDINYKKVSTCLLCTDWHNFGKKWSMKERKQFCCAAAGRITI